MKVDKSKWEKKTLGEVACIYDSQRMPVAKSNRISGEYPYYGANGLQDYVSEYIFDGRYLLVGEDGGKWGAKEESTYIVEGKIWVNNHAHILQFENNVVDSFVRYYLNFADLTKYVTGSIVPKLTQANLKKISLLLPKSINEQQSIASELDAIQTMIDGYKAQLDDLDELAKSIFLDMFGDPVENKKGWEIICLKDVGTFARGVSKHRPRNAPELLGGTMPLIQTGDIANAGMYILTFKDTYSDLGIAQSKVWPSGTLCITIAANIGKCSILTFDACFPDSVVGYSVNKDYILNEYVYFVFLGIQNMVESKAAGIAQKNINLQFLNALAIPVPPLTLQQQFAAKIEAIETQKEKYKAQLADAEQLMAERMQYYFS